MGSQRYWLWFCIEPINSSVLAIYISELKNIFVAEKFIIFLYPNLVNMIWILMGVYGIQKHTMSCLNTFYIHHFRKVWGRVNQYFKDRTESFDDYYYVFKINAIYFKYITGYNSLFLGIMLQLLRRIILLSSKKWYKYIIN